MNLYARKLAAIAGRTGHIAPRMGGSAGNAGWNFAPSL